MREVLVFGGTTEGRRLASWLAGHNSCHVVYLATTDLGHSLVDPLVESHAAKLDAAGMMKLAAGRDVCLVVDATHPYAHVVSGEAATLAAAIGVDVLRVLRPATPIPTGAIRVPDAVSCARALDETDGNVLLTTGTKDLDAFCRHIRAFEERLFVRILPTVESLTRALALGIDQRHLCCLMGPCSLELNVAMIHEFGCAHLVTKESGAIGGFPEKVEAAAATGCTLWVIERPCDRGVGFDEALRLMEVRYGL